MKSSVIIISNPAARGSSIRKIEEAARVLANKGFRTEILMTGKRGDAECLARTAAADRPHSIMAAGGDGTINEVINGIVRSGVPLSILPLGTTNVLARELGIGNSVEEAAEKAATSDARDVSLGLIETGEGPSHRCRYFCLMAGIGFDGKSVHDMNKTIKKVSGKAAYVLSGIKNIIAYAPERFTVVTETAEFNCHQAIIGKAARYGGDFKVTPDADLREPELYCCTFGGGRRRDLLRYVIGVTQGRHLSFEDVSYTKTRTVEVRGSAHIQIDGDYHGMSPARISVAPDVLRLIW